jgi:hypothetical protein
MEKIFAPSGQVFRNWTRKLASRLRRLIFERVKGVDRDAVRQVTAAVLASLLIALAGAPQDSADGDSIEKKKAELDRKTSELFWEYAQKLGQAEDFEGEAVLSATAYFLVNQKEILSGAWKLPAEGADKSWDKVQQAYEKLRAAKATKSDAKLMGDLAKAVGYAPDEGEGSHQGAPTIQIKGWQGFDVTIRDENGKLKIEYQTVGGKAASKDEKVKFLESIKKTFDNARVRKAVEEEIKRLETGGGASNGKGTEPAQHPPASRYSDTISLQYLKLSKEAAVKGLKDLALNCEVLGYQIRYLPDTIEGLRVLNGFRRTAGLKPAGYAALLSYACALHSRYLANESVENTYGLRAHEEVEKSPFRTAMGAEAGRSSVISSGTVVDSIHGWMATFYHRISLIDPNLEKAGIGRWAPGSMYNVCVDSKTGVASRPDSGIVSFPANDQTGVPTSFDPFGEVPDPLPNDVESAGFPITLSFFPASNASQVSAVKAALSIDGKEVPCWISWPGNPANKSRPTNSNSFCIIAKNPLRPKAEYSVRIKATVNGKEGTWEWRFRTIGD